MRRFGGRSNPSRRSIPCQPQAPVLRTANCLVTGQRRLKSDSIIPSAYRRIGDRTITGRDKEFSPGLLEEKGRAEAMRAQRSGSSEIPWTGSSRKGSPIPTLASTICAIGSYGPLLNPKARDENRPSPKSCACSDTRARLRLPVALISRLASALSSCGVLRSTRFGSLGFSDQMVCGFARD